MTNFSNLAVVCRKISKLTSKKRMIKEFSDFISKLNPEDVRRSILIISGRIFPPGEDRSLGVSWGLIWKALKEISGLSDSELYNIVSGSVDIGEAARRVVASSKRRLTTLITPKPLTIDEVHEIFKKLSLLEGKGSQRNKRLLLVELFSRASPDEAEIIAKSLVGEVRIGFHEGLMVEAVSKAFEIPVELVREKTMATGDLSYVAYIAATAGLKGVSNITIGLYRPLKPMLASDVHSIQEALRRAKGEKLAFEYKFDGARVQIHVGEEGVRIYSRRLKDVTESLPDVVKQVKEGLSRDVECILDGEAVAIGSDGRPLPFQHVMRRFGREKEITKLLLEIPMKLHVFDILYFNGKDLINAPYIERRELLEKVYNGELAEKIISSDIPTIQSFLKRSVTLGYEGLMAKRIGSPYRAGSRGYMWMKIKPTLPHLDLVIVAADRGYGRRHKWLSNYHLAARDEETGRFLIVGKTFKGLTDEEFEQMTRKLLEIEVGRFGHTVKVKPEIVVEVAYNEIQKSPHYKSGYALRFARIVAIRWDKTAEEADTIKKIERIYLDQFKYKSRDALERYQ